MGVSLDSSSTPAEVLAQYLDSCDYDLVGSTEKCRNYIHALRMMAGMTPDEIESAGERMKEPYEKYKSLIAEAQKWLQSNDSTYSGRVGRVTHVSFETFRD